MRVNVTIFHRYEQGKGPTKEEEQYTETLRQEGLEIDDLNMAIDWWFPGGDAALDKIEIDNVEYTGDQGPNCA